MKHRDEILKLRAEGKTYNEIKEITGASKGTISYHCGNGQKEKYYNRQKHNKKIRHPYISKLHSFLYENNKNINIINGSNYKILTAIKNKINTFHTDRKTREVKNMSFTLEDLINKFGENPKCYLTGDDIDIYKPKTYQFDHIIPVSKGGENTLDNLGICLKEANIAKNNLLLEDFYNLCKKIVIFNKLS